MAAPVNYYWGDVLTKGNTVINQTLAVQGWTSVVQNVYATQIGATFTPFASLSVNKLNTQLNTGSIAAGVGVGTTTVAALGVQGNVFVSTNISTPNAVATVLNSLYLNTQSLSGFIGIGTSSASASLQIQNNVNVSGTVTTSNANFRTVNTVYLNTSSIAEFVGIGTNQAGSTLYVQGDVKTTSSVT